MRTLNGPHRRRLHRFAFAFMNVPAQAARSASEGETTRALSETKAHRRQRFDTVRPISQALCAMTAMLRSGLHTIPNRDHALFLTIQARCGVCQGRLNVH